MIKVRGDEGGGSDEGKPVDVDEALFVALVYTANRNVVLGSKGHRFP